MTIRMGAREVRSSLADLLGRVHYSGEAVIVERFGKPASPTGRQGIFRAISR